MSITSEDIRRKILKLSELEAKYDNYEKDFDYILSNIDKYIYNSEEDEDIFYEIGEKYFSSGLDIKRVDKLYRIYDKEEIVPSSIANLYVENDCTELEEESEENIDIKIFRYLSGDLDSGGLGYIANIVKYNYDIIYDIPEKYFNRVVEAVNSGDDTYFDEWVFDEIIEFVFLLGKAKESRDKKVEIERLKEENLHLRYAYGGIGYQEAKEEFESQI